MGTKKLVTRTTLYEGKKAAEEARWLVAYGDAAKEARNTWGVDTLVDIEPIPRKDETVIIRVRFDNVGVNEWVSSFESLGVYLHRCNVVSCAYPNGSFLSLGHAMYMLAIELHIAWGSEITKAWKRADEINAQPDSGEASIT